MPDSKKILCAIDLSEGSPKVVNAAAEMARVLDAELVLVHVFDHPLYNLPTGFNPPAGYSAALLEADKGIRAHLEARLEEHMKDLERGDVKAECCLVEGPAARTIIEHAQGEGFSMIVIGTHGHTGVKHMLLGSVAERIVRTSDCPVLTVPTKS